MDEQAVIEQTRRWIAEVVIGLNLCPFAQRPFREDRIRFAVTAAADEVGLLRALEAELKALAAAPAEQVETTLLIHPHALPDFLDHNDFLTPAEDLVRRLGLRGVIQVVGFHPHYRFAGAAQDAVENYTNRSPQPMLHLLREESIARAAADAAEVEAIPRRNLATLRALGLAAIQARLQACWTKENLAAEERR